MLTRGELGMSVLISKPSLTPNSPQNFRLADRQSSYLYEQNEAKKAKDKQALTKLANDRSASRYEREEARSILKEQEAASAPVKPKPEPKPATPAAKKNWWQRNVADRVNKVEDAVKDTVSTVGEVASDGVDWAKRNKDVLSEFGHTALDVAGMIPVAGTAFDAIHAGWYAAEGDYANAALSLAGMVPGAGDAAIAAKLAMKGAKLAKKSEKVIGTAQNVIDKGERAYEAYGAVQEAQGVVEGVSAAYGEFAKGNYLNGALALTQTGVSAVGGYQGAKAARGNRNARPERSPGSDRASLPDGSSNPFSLATGVGGKRDPLESRVLTRWTGGGERTTSETSSSISRRTPGSNRGGSSFAAGERKDRQTHAPDGRPLGYGNGSIRPSTDGLARRGDGGKTPAFVRQPNSTLTITTADPTSRKPNRELVAAGVGNPSDTVASPSAKANQHPSGSQIGGDDSSPAPQTGGGGSGNPPPQKPPTGGGSSHSINGNDSSNNNGLPVGGSTNSGNGGSPPIPPSSPNHPLGNGESDGLESTVAEALRQGRAIPDVASDGNFRRSTASQIADAIRSAQRTRPKLDNQPSGTSAATENGRVVRNGYVDDPGLGKYLVNNRHGTTFKGSRRDHGIPGSASATHAEPKVVELDIRSNPNSAITALAVDRPVCRSQAKQPNGSSGWCVDHLSLTAMLEKRTIVVAEPGGVWVFHPDIPANFFEGI